MKDKVIEKRNLPGFIEGLAKEYTVLAPVKEQETISFQRISDENPIDLDFWNTKKPPKEVFFPQTETMFTYKISEDEVEIEEVPETEGKRVVLGVRPCDARSFALLDKFFASGDNKDVYYLEKRNNTIVLGLACRNPLSTCFCTSLGGSPFGKEGMDILLKDLNGKYLIEPVTQRGEELVERLSWLNDATTEDLNRARKLSMDAEATITSKVPVKEAIEKLDGMFDDQLWNQVYQKCLGCGVCTFLCPTCCCFDILEEGEDGGRRVRIWDSCQFSCFTQQGGGHNPRPSGKERMRQRIMHKFNYFVKNHDESFCVGCGRCVRECPVNLDIREVVSAITTGTEDGD